MHYFEEGAVPAVCTDKLCHDISVWYTGEQMSQPDIPYSVATKFEKVYPIMQYTKFPVALCAVY
jgi:hypothetical protein